jgi:hypothetical protein
MFDGGRTSQIADRGDVVGVVGVSVVGAAVVLVVVLVVEVDDVLVDVVDVLVDVVVVVAGGVDDGATVDDVTAVVVTAVVVDASGVPLTSAVHAAAVTPTSASTDIRTAARRRRRGRVSIGSTRGTSPSLPAVVSIGASWGRLSPCREH